MSGEQSQPVPKTPKHRMTICVSGAARGKTVDMDYKLAFELGRQVALHGHTLITGATVGLPDWAAQGAKSVGGMSIGISPAASLREHLNKYRLPTTAYDFILYTGMHYVGRDALLVQSSDAVLSVGGRMGTVHEFATAIESHIPVGVLLLAVAILWMGLHPQPFTDVMQVSVTELLRHVAISKLN